ncbi:MAG: sensor histidine kinase [Saprospiraceae bacterium]|nr:sensor histidine kinase [Saprospiraceae bacterium]
MLKIKQFLPHILGSLAFIALPVLTTAPHPDISWGMFHSDPAKRDLLTYIPMLLFFYFNYFVLIPRFYFTKKYLSYLSILVLFLGLIIFLPTYFIKNTHQDNHKIPPSFEEINRQPPPVEGINVPPPPPFEEKMLRKNSESAPLKPDDSHIGHKKGFTDFIDFIEFSHFLFLFLAVTFVSLALRINQQLKQTEADKLNAELAYLKTQINPHFLFNTLNSIYALAITENADQTSTAIVKLSGMMRYVVSETEKDFIPLEKEVNYLEDFIAMQKLRLGNTVKITPSVKGHFLGKKIAPLILVTFVENAFKHGVNAEDTSEIFIQLGVLDNDLTLIVKNNKVTTSLNGLNKSGIGIENAKNRLQLLYPNKHQLMIDDGEKEYTVLLTINLTT